MMEVGEKKNVGSSTNGEDGSDGVVVELMGVIETVGSYSGFRKTHRKECVNLVRRLKLLVPLLEEMKELDIVMIISTTKALNSLVNLKNALSSAKKLLKNCSSGSKIYLVSLLSLPLSLLFLSPELAFGFLGSQINGFVAFFCG